MDKNLFFFILALLCGWLILDEVYGNKFISQFVVSIIPNTEKEGAEAPPPSGQGKNPSGFDGYGNFGNLPSTDKNTDKSTEKESLQKEDKNLKLYTI